MIETPLHPRLLVFIVAVAGGAFSLGSATLGMFVYTGSDLVYTTLGFGLGGLFVLLLSPLTISQLSERGLLDFNHNSGHLSDELGGIEE